MRSWALSASLTGASLLLAAGSCQGSHASSAGGAGMGGALGTGTGGGSTGPGLFGDSGLGGASADGCGGPAADAGDGDGSTGCEGIEGGVTYKEVGTVLAGCQGETCHGAPTHDMVVGVAAYECCDGRLLVDPGNAAQSYLLDKVEGHDLCQGDRMPWMLPPLSDADLLTIRRWICEGAPAQ
jgi:hypothetical protein